MRALLVLLLLAGCPRARPAQPAPEPPATPVPVEIQWPDGGVDAG